jgi:uncharacterized protein YndB with AHSA1/START domain
MGVTRIIAEPGSPRIVITREFDAPRELVYRAHTDPALLVRWLGPRRLTMHVDEYDVRHGGRYRYVHREADGTEYGFRGVFHGDPSPDGITQTFEFEGAPGHVSLETARFIEQDGRTTLRIESVHQSVEARDAMIAGSMETGVNEGYERLDELLAGQLAVAH